MEITKFILDGPYAEARLGKTWYVRNPRGRRGWHVETDARGTLAKVTDPEMLDLLEGEYNWYCGPTVDDQVAVAKECGWAIVRRNKKCAVLRKAGEQPVFAYDGFMMFWRKTGTKELTLSDTKDPKRIWNLLTR